MAPTRRFFAMVWPRQASRLEEDAARIAERLSQIGWRTHKLSDTALFAFLVTKGQSGPYFFEGGRGAILGRACADERGGVELALRARPAAFAESLGRHWGAFVVLRAVDQHLDVYRDPTGALACYRTRYGEIDCIFSHGADARLALGARFSIDWTETAARMGFDGLVREKTGLIGVEEILPGGFVSVGARSASAFYWDPRALYETQRFGRRSQAGAALRRAVESVLRAETGASGESGCLMAALSGGLDSSIVVGGLAKSVLWGGRGQNGDGSIGRV